MSSFKVVWTIKELVEVLRSRQLNKFDCNFGVSGNRGNGKSTLLLKIFKSFKEQGFKQKKHQVYSQKDVTRLLAAQKFGFCWDDEAINSGYKRNFQTVGQKVLIQIITNYRDNFNIYGSAVPFFYSLDKALRELMFMHLHIVERGMAVVFLPLADNVHTQDPWDTKNNIRIEEAEARRMKKNPDLKFRWHKFSTFAGYLYFGPMSPKQEEIYNKIKTEKRFKNFEQTLKEEELSFNEKCYKLLMEGKLTKEGLMQACLVQGKRYSVVSSNLSTTLRDKGEKKTLNELFVVTKPVHKTDKGSIISMVPNVPL